MKHPSRVTALCAAALVLALASARTHAITYGHIDVAGAFGNTGAFMVKSPAGNNFPICTGTLIAPRVFLTASHCTDYFEQTLAPLGFTAYVSFDGVIPWGALTSPATKLVTVTGVYTNPNYDQTQNDPGDIAVLTVDAAQTVGITPAVLPTAGLLDALGAKNGLKGTVFTNAGYGLQDRVTGGGTPFFNDANPVPRMYAFSSFDALNKVFLRLSQNASTGDGGTCFGDSGGPNFLTVDGREVLVAITITGDAVCRATNVDYRLDSAPARAFLAPFVTLP